MAVGSGTLTGCLLKLRPPGPPSLADSVVARSQLSAALLGYWQSALPYRPDLALTLGHEVTALPSHSNLAARSAARRMLQLAPELDDVDTRALAPREFLALQALQWRLGTDAAAYTFHDLDLSALSPVETPLRVIVDVLRRLPMENVKDLERYFFLLEEAALWVADMRAALEERSTRGVVAPIDVVLAFVRDLRELRRLTLDGALRLSNERLANFDSASRALARTQEATAMNERLVPVIDSLALWLEGSYATEALTRPGLWQYPGGKEYYRHLLRRYSGLEIEPQDAHQTGLAGLQRVDSLLSVVRRQAGWNPLADVVRDSLSRLREWVGVPMDTVIARTMERQAALSAKLPAAIAPLPASAPKIRQATPLEAWLFPPGRVVPPLHSDSSTTIIVTERWTRPDAVMGGPDLGFRWVWPGAALAATVAFSTEEGSGFVLLHPVVSTQAGWSEYAASLAGELGMYADPLHAYGRLLHDGLSAALLVVDTGIHYFGWTRQQATQLLRRYSVADDATLDALLVDEVIATPGRAGAGALGAGEFAALRAWMQDALGEDFNAPDFHRELVSLGPAPLPVLAAHLEWWEWERQRTRRREDERMSDRTRTR